MSELSEAARAYRETPAAQRFAALAADAEERVRAVRVTPVQFTTEPEPIDVEPLRRWATRVAHAYVELHAAHPEWSVEEAVQAALDLLGW